MAEPVSADFEVVLEKEGELIYALRKFKKNKRGVFGAGLALVLIFAALFAPYIVPFDPFEMHLDSILNSASSKYILGTDEFGRDIFSRLIYGARLSLMIGIGAVTVKMFLSVAMGLAAGYLKGVVDQLIMRTLDVIHAFPRLLLAMLIIAVTGPSLLAVTMVLAVTGLPRFTRIIRGAVLSVQERDYILAARALGVKDLRIVLRHILPNVFAPVIILISLEMAHVIMSESSLSFLGFGAETTIPSWGNMLSAGRPYIREHPGLVLYPGLGIMLTVMAFNFLGDALRDILDPKFRRQ